MVQFSRVHNGEIKPVAKAPEATGFENRLYEMKDHDPAEAQQFEELFLKPLDTKAAESLELLYRHGHLAPWTSETRSDWTRFVLSLLLRCPEDINMFREWWTVDFERTDAEAEDRYLKSRNPEDPDTFVEYLTAQRLRVKERAMFVTLNTLLEGESVGAHINTMHWRILQTPASAPLLLTSDRPVLRTNSLNRAGDHIALPIGPRLLFIASHDEKYLEDLLRLDQTMLVKECNRQIVEGAVRFVFASDEKQRRFVENRFGKHPQPRPMESIVGSLRKGKGTIF